jgi:hypothetical protein
MPTAAQIHAEKAKIDEFLDTQFLKPKGVLVLYEGHIIFNVSVPTLPGEVLIHTIATDESWKRHGLASHVFAGIIQRRGLAYKFRVSTVEDSNVPMTSLCRRFEMTKTSPNPGSHWARPLP